MSDRKISEVTKTLIKARQIIDKEENWTIGFLARDRNNKPTNIFHENAFSFCAWGALDKAHLEQAGRWVSRPYAAGYILEQICGRCVASYNNSHTHKEVLQLFDDAIALSVEKDQQLEKANV